MGGKSGGDTDPDHSALRYQKEQDRIDERRRRRGQQMVDAYFDGGRYATGDAVSDFESIDPTRTYYTPTGDEWRAPVDWFEPDSRSDETVDFMEGEDGASLTRDEAYQELYDAGDKDTIRAEFGDMSQLGTSGSSDEEFKDWERRTQRGLYTDLSDEQQGFDDSFYEQRADAYLDYANPQVEEQHRDAAEELAYGLAQGGVGQSSIAANRQAELSDAYEQAREQVARDAQGQADQAREAVSEERQRMSDMVASGQDPSRIRGELPGVADALRQDPDFDPVGHFFSDVTAGLAASNKSRQEQRAAEEARKRYGSPRETSPHS